MAVLVGAAWTSGELAEWRRHHQKNLKHIGPAEKKRVASMPQNEQLARTPEPLCQKQKKQNHLPRSPDGEVGESQGRRELHFGERKESGQEPVEEKMAFTLKEGRFKRGRASKESLFCKSKRKGEWTQKLSTKI